MIPPGQASDASAVPAATGSSDGADSSVPASSEPASAGCSALASSLSVEEQVGQLFMVGVSTSGLDESTRQAISLGRVGSVVLLGNSDAGVEDVRLLTAQLGTLGSAALPLLVAADQEGGRVQRLAGEGFDDMPSAAQQGKMSDDALRAASQEWGGQLISAGVRYNLAPVADIVTAGQEADNAPIGALGRNYATDAGLASEKVSAFVEGMHAAGVGTALKHFPGLGRVEINTDFGAAVDDVTGPDDPSIDVFRAGLAAGADTVMVSSAVFRLIDPDSEAVFSHTVITDLLRGDLGFDGVVIADDLGVARAVADVAPGDRAIRFLQAGGDLAISADPAIMSDMIDATLARARQDAGFAERVAESAGRVLDLKAALGLMACG